MLQDEDVLASVNVKVDYLMSGSSLAEHGYNLIDVNRYELCAQETTEQEEWWSFVSCMYSMQSCLSYNTTEAADDANMTCATAEAGTDDDETIAGLDSVSDSCDCTVEGVASECASEYITSSTFEGLKSCVHSDMGHTLAQESTKRAEAANSGSPLWIKLDNITVYDATNEVDTIVSWAQSVFASTCLRIEYLGGTAPSSCDSVTSNSISN